MIDFLFLSNGHGEDAIAAEIARRIPSKYRIAAMPLVGAGEGYKKSGISVLCGQSGFGSGSGGALPRIRRQWSALKSYRDEVLIAVAVGDIYPALLAYAGLRGRFVFMGTAKSVFVQPYNFFEQWVLRKAEIVFVRDQPTAKVLNERGTAALYVGNPMMDEVYESRISISSFDGITVTLLPGSRERAPQNFSIQVEALKQLRKKMGKPVRGYTALPPTLPIKKFLEKLEGWRLVSSRSPREETLGDYAQGEISLHFLSGSLGDAVRASSLVFGQAGTANEQAAGLGKPVVSFDSWRAIRLSWYRWRQKKLLGDAVAIVSPDPEKIAGKAFEILQDSRLYKRMGEEGMRRMGPPGACREIVACLFALLSKGKIPAARESLNL